MQKGHRDQAPDFTGNEGNLLIRSNSAQQRGGVRKQVLPVLGYRGLRRSRILNARLTVAAVPKINEDESAKQMRRQAYVGSSSNDTLSLSTRSVTTSPTH